MLREISYRTSKLTLVLAIGFYALLATQLMTSMRIDAYELGQSRIDVAGYWVGLLFAALLTVRLLSRAKLQVLPLFLVLLLMIYATAVMVITAAEQSPIAFLLSRYGLLTWFLLGIGAGSTFQIFREARQQRLGQFSKLMFAAVAGGVGVSVSLFALEYLVFPVSTKNYQSVSSSATIFLITTVYSIEAIWGDKKSLLVSASYLAVGTILVAAVTSMQSTLIVALWCCLVGIFFWQFYLDSRIFQKLIFLAAWVVSSIYFFQTEFLEDIMRNTRFSVFTDGGNGEFSSLTSRIKILNNFADQFSVSPIFGNFQAEIISGFGEGMYVHSLPLSFLTHTGVIGGGLFIASVGLLLRQRVFHKPGIDPMERLSGRLMLMILAIGTISTFMSWSVLWFMLGVLCIRPAKIF